jgi:hypothetical protein
MVGGQNYVNKLLCKDGAWRGKGSLTGQLEINLWTLLFRSYIMTLQCIHSAIRPGFVSIPPLLLMAFHPNQVLAIPSQQPSSAYIIEGQVEFKEIRYSSENAQFYYSIKTNEFKAEVSECRWHITLGTHDPSVYDYRMVSSDGESTYLLLDYSTRHRMAREQKTSGSSIEIAENLGDGTVTSGNLPRFSLAHEAGAIWLAYGSSCHFLEDARSKRRQAPFITYMRPSNVGPGDPPVVQHAEWSLSQKPPFLPDVVKYYIPDPAKEGWDVPGMWKGPFTNVVFRVNAYTTIDGLVFPQDSTTSIYRLMDPGRNEGSATQLSQEMRVTATNIIVGATTKNSFKPVLPGKTLVTDERFNDGTGITLVYFSESHWPNRAAARNSEAYIEALSAVEWSRGREDNWSLRILVLTFLTLITIGLFTIVNRKKQPG